MAGAALLAAALSLGGGRLAAQALTIDEASTLAAGNAASVKVASAQLSSATAAEAAARAAYMPTITASASGAYLPYPPQTTITLDAGALGTSKIWGPAPPSDGGVFNANGTYSGPLKQYSVSMPSNNISFVETNEHSYFKGNVTFAQPLVAWGKIRAAVEAARHGTEAALASRNAAVLDAVRGANRAYYSARVSRESAAILAELRGLAAQIVADRESTLMQGLATQADLLSSRADLADIDARIVDAREGEASALASLAVLTGRPGLADPAKVEYGSDYRSSLPAVDESSFTQAAVSSSTDRALAAARFAQATSKLDLERGSSMLLPDLALFASLDASGQTVPFSEAGGDWWDNTWTWSLSVGVQVSMNVFDGGRSWADIASAKADRDATAAALAGSSDAARLAARQALQAARHAEAALRSDEARAAWTAEILRNASLSSSNQLLSRQDYNRAAIQDAGARLELLAARYAFEEALADLERLAPKAFGAHP
jgi:outer membrane protein TolC